MRFKMMLVLGSFFLNCLDSQASLPVRLVLRPGDAAPGTGGGLFGGISNACINSSGQLMFDAGIYYPGPPEDAWFSVWLEDVPGHFIQVSRTGDVSPLTGHTVTDYVRSSLLSDDGTIAANVQTDGPLLNAQELWLIKDGVTSVPARQGGPAPGVGTGSFAFILANVLNAGHAAIRTAAGSPYLQGIWHADANGANYVAIEGQPAPDTTHNFDDLSAPTINSNGDVVFSGVTDGSMSPFSTDPFRRGVWSQGTGSNTLNAVALSGQNAPGGGTFRYFKDPFYEDLQVPVINNAGKCAFTAWYNPTTDRDSGAIQAIYSQGHGSLDRVAAAGDPAPGVPGGTFTWFGPMALNGAGDVAFFASAGETHGIWAQRGGVLVPVVKTGDPAPGANGVFSEISLYFEFNGRGQVIFYGYEGGFNGIWATDRIGTLVPIAVAGQLFDVDTDPGVQHRLLITETGFGGETGGLQDGRRAVFNDLGQAFVTLLFYDSVAEEESLAYYVFTVSCPADFNGDTVVNPDDLSEFITCFFLNAQVPGSCDQADFNGDGFVDPDDLSEFITSFFVATQNGC